MMMLRAHFRNSSRAAVRALVAVLAVAATACDKVPLLAPSGSTVTLTAPTRTLPIGGTTEVTATVLESGGTPVQNGTTVTFTATLGTITTQAQTRDGVATATFNAGSSSGVAEIRATSGAAGASGSGTTTPPATGGTPTAPTSSNALQITIGAANTNAVVVSASPSTVPPSGGTVSIIASATDANGNRLTGVPVSFSTTAGTLSSSSAIADENGNATVRLTTNQTATVTAAAGSKTATVTVNAATANSLSLSLSPSQPSSGQPVTLTVTPTIGTNNVAPRVVIDWGDGTQTDLGVVGAPRTVAHTYALPGNYTITATATANGETFTSSIGAFVISTPLVTITASPTSGPFLSTTFTFTVTPAPGTAPTGVRVDFGDGTSVDLGPITSATTVTKRYSAAGTYTVRVTQTNLDATTSTAVIVVSATP
jgi:PKD repeat protein